MLFKLPTQITNVSEAKAYLKQLCDNGMAYNCEDDNAFDIDFLNISEDARPTVEECEHMNMLMAQIYNLPENGGRQTDLGFDPCGYMLDLMKQFEDKSGNVYSLAEIRDEGRCDADIIEWATKAEQGDVWEDIKRIQ